MMRSVWWLGFCALVAVSSASSQRSRPSFCDDGPTHSRPGACYNLNVTYTYNSAADECQEVPHGGCLAADNVFETKRECETTCLRNNNQDVCNSDRNVPGISSCFNREKTWTFYTDSQRCEEIPFGGCTAADGVFETEEECRNRCEQSSNVCNTDRNLRGISSCFNREKTWTFYFDSQRCEEIPFGGCTDTDGVFETEEQCRNACEQGTNNNDNSGRTDVCNTDRNVRGISSCFNREKTWTFYTDSQRCEEIPYGGCTSANGVFETEEECRNTCERGNNNNNNNNNRRRPDFCNVPRDARGRSSCYNREKTWSFYPDTERCEEISQGGCTGADNVFESEQECQDACEIEQEDVFNPQRDCLLRAETGRCRARKIRYYYNKDLGECERFRYGGCRGNKNNFLTKDDCDRSCTNVLNQDRCTARPDPGPCEALFPRFYYDTETRQCQRFNYGGCQGNSNNYETEDECRRACHSSNDVTPRRRLGPGPSRPTVTRPTGDRCLLPEDKGPCDALMTMYTFDPEISDCRAFVYGGCGGNLNRFVSLSECRNECQEHLNIQVPTEQPDFCRQGHMQEGFRRRCTGYFPKWTYNFQERQCKSVVYGGCGGTRNLFDSQDECEATCDIGSARGRSTTGSNYRPPAPTNTPLVPFEEARPNPACLLEADAGPCEAAIPSYYYNRFTRRCEVFQYGGCQGNANRFEDSLSCQRACFFHSHIERTVGPPQPPPVPTPERKPDFCREGHLEPGTRIQCAGYFPKWTYDYEDRRCQSVIYGGCGGTRNLFDTREECQSTCGVGDRPDLCMGGTGARGVCRNLNTTWTYNSEYDRCETIPHGGCTAAPNVFHTFEECERTCVPGNSPSRPPAPPPETGRPERPGPVTGGPGLPGPVTRSPARPGTVTGGPGRPGHGTVRPHFCAQESTVDGLQGMCFNFNTTWMYSRLEDRCVPITYGGCGASQNNFQSEQECRRICRPGSSSVTNVCELDSEPGICFGSFPRFYFNRENNRCEPFIYGGCGGNGNNFESYRECQRQCGGRPVPGITGPECDRRQCTWKYWTHYVERGCQPVYDSGSCCPTRFNCPPSHIGNDRNCYVNGTRFAPGSSIEDTGDPCSRNCRCEQRGPGLDVVCVSVECPSLFGHNRPGPNCYRQFEEGRCCSTGNACKAPGAGTCEAEGQVYHYGQKMYFEDGSCQQCICGPDYTDQYGPGCRKTLCNVDLHYQSRLRSGCVPFYIERGCCPIPEFYCPDIDLAVPVSYSEIQQQGLGQSGECMYGDTRIPLGGILSVQSSNPCDTCQCLTPPQLTCIKQTCPEQSAPPPGCQYEKTEGKCCDELVCQQNRCTPTSCPRGQRCIERNQQIRCVPGDNSGKPAFCNIPRDQRPPGACFNREVTWTYFPDTDSCEEIPFGGCTAADNVFETLQECQGTCMEGLVVNPGQCPEIRPDTVGACVEECATDGDCPPGSKCCSNGCGHQCTRPLLRPPTSSCQREYCPPECQLRQSSSDPCGTCVCPGGGGSGGGVAPDKPAFCNVPRDQRPPGACNNRQVTWTYFPDTDRCEEIRFGGCTAAEDVFETLRECQETCKPAQTEQPDFCRQGHLQEGLRRQCTAYFPKWTYNFQERQCKSVVYGGCGGTRNLFDSKQECEAMCDIGNNNNNNNNNGGVRPAFCNSDRNMPGIRSCFNRQKTFVFYGDTNRCEEIPFGGCLSADNVFATEEECRNTCLVGCPLVSCAPECTLRQSPSDPCGTCVCPGRGVGSTKPSFCNIPRNQRRIGACNNPEVTWTYFPDTDRCEEISFGGCTQADIIFETLQECQDTCKPGNNNNNNSGRPGVCSIDRNVPGISSCFNREKTWTFYRDSQRCEEIPFGGCTGTDGVFETEEDCRNTCERRSNVCNSNRNVPGISSCFNREKSWTFYTDSQRCEEIPTGGCTGTDGVFETEEQCRNTCERRRNNNNNNNNNGRPDFCNVPRDARGRSSCFNRERTWSFYPDTERCEVIPFGGCTSAQNVFQTEQECRNACERGSSSSGQPAFCSEHFLHNPTRQCFGSFPKFWYNITTAQCQSVTYGGCGATENLFDTRRDCVATCDIDGDHPINVRPDFCDVPRSQRGRGVCANRDETWTYYPESRRCERIAYGGCLSSPGVFRTEEDCTNVCVNGLEVHEGQCPAPQPGSAGVCTEECSSDIDCHRDFKCCSNGCGQSCMRVFRMSHASCPDSNCPPECSFNNNENDPCGTCICPQGSSQAEKPGSCPAPPPGSAGICVERCRQDADCPHSQKCCSNGCGHVCVQPQTYSHQGCPPLNCPPGCTRRREHPSDRCEGCHCPTRPPIQCPPLNCPSECTRRKAHPNDQCDTCYCTGGAQPVPDIQCAPLNCPSDCTRRKASPTDLCDTCYCYGSQRPQTSCPPLRCYPPCSQQPDPQGGPCPVCNCDSPVKGRPQRPSSPSNCPYSPATCRRGCRRIADHNNCIICQC